jgi:hypothetical protein
MREKRTFFRGMGAQVIGALPPEARQLVTPGALPTSLTFPERLRLEVGIAKLLRKRIEQAFVASLPLDAEPSAGAPPAQAQRLVVARDALRAKGTAATDDDRRRFASALFEDRLLGLRRRLGAEERASDAMRRGERFGALAKATFPDAFAAATDDVARLAAKGREGLAPLLAEATRTVPPAQRPPPARVPAGRGSGAGAGSPRPRRFQATLLALGWTQAESRRGEGRGARLCCCPYRHWFGGGAGRWGGAGGRQPRWRMVGRRRGQGPGGGWRRGPPRRPAPPGMDAERHGRPDGRRREAHGSGGTTRVDVRRWGVARRSRAFRPGPLRLTGGDRRFGVGRIGPPDPEWLSKRVARPCCRVLRRSQPQGRDIRDRALRTANLGSGDAKLQGPNRV